MREPMYDVSIDARSPESHRVRITIKPNKSSLPQTLKFPVWTPGSYLVREYSRHVTNMENAKKIDKNSWQVLDTDKAVSFEVYCFERTVRTSYLDANLASFVGATLLPLLYDTFSVTLELPSRWNTLGTALKTKKLGPGRWRFAVSGDDEWIDCPIVAATPGYGGSKNFRVGSIPHRLTWIGVEPKVAMTKIVHDTQKICLAAVKMFGGAPFRSYEVLLDFAPKAYGGLEHRNSQLSHFDPFELLDPKKYEQFLGLVSHEYFHAWNVKSLRPEALGPFNYFAENYTEELWFAEGLTAYFDDYVVWLAGLISQETYYQARLKDVSNLRDGLPAHHRRSVAESSFDAWIRYYRPDEDSGNTDVSYYIKGAMVAWCWDARLQQRTKKRWNLAKLMRAFWLEFGADSNEDLRDAKPGFTRAQLFEFAKEKTRMDHSIVESWVNLKKPLPWREAARFFKVPFRERVNSRVQAQFGMNAQDKDGKTVVSQVYSGSSAEAAELQANDEIIALEGQRIQSADHLQKILELSGKKKKLELLCARAGKIQQKTIESRKHAGLGVEIEFAKK